MTPEAQPGEEPAKQDLPPNNKPAKQDLPPNNKPAKQDLPRNSNPPAMRDERRKGGEPSTEGADPGRRSFFRAFGREALHTAASVAGAADALRRGTTAAGAEILGLGLGTPGALDRLRGAVADSDESSPAVSPSSVPVGRQVKAGVPGEIPTGFHSPYRLEGDALFVLDQQELPKAAQEIRCADGYEVAAAIRDHAVEGGALLGQLAAYGMALTARGWQAASAEDRDGRLRVAAAALRNARAAPASLEWAVERVESRWQSLGSEASGDAIADALRAEADAIATQATLDHARLGRLGAERLRPPSATRPMTVLTLGSIGALAGGNVGTALAVINALIADGEQVEAWVMETRPALLGARLTAWELSQAGVSYTLVPDVAAGWLLANGRVDAVLVGAERIAANGDALAVAGTYPVAVLASRQGVPFYVCAATPTIDARCAAGAALPHEDRPGGEVATMGGESVIPLGAHLVSPAVDVTPADLISGFLTEMGVIEAPFGEQLAAAVEGARAGRLQPVPA